MDGEQEATDGCFGRNKGEKIQILGRFVAPKGKTRGKFLAKAPVNANAPSYEW